MLIAIGGERKSSSMNQWRRAECCSGRRRREVTGGRSKAQAGPSEQTRPQTAGCRRAASWAAGGAADRARRRRAARRGEVDRRRPGWGSRVGEGGWWAAGEGGSGAVRPSGSVVGRRLRSRNWAFVGPFLDCAIQLGWATYQFGRWTRLRFMGLGWPSSI